MVERKDELSLRGSGTPDVLGMPGDEDPTGSHSERPKIPSLTDIEKEVR